MTSSAKMEMALNVSDTEGFSKDYKKAKFYFEKVCKKGSKKDEQNFIEQLE